MAVFNFGSINIDHVYQVPHFVQPGETLSSSEYQQLLGGKGANQSIALAQAGVVVSHVGKLSATDHQYKQRMESSGVDCRFVELVDSASGHAIIQVTPSAENAIFLFGGANQLIDADDIQQALDNSQPGDWVLTQNETSAIAEVIEQAHNKGIKVAFNPAPMTAEVKQLPLELVDLLIVNEVEGAELTGVQEPEQMAAYFARHYPNTEVIITLGKAGVKMLGNGNELNVSAFSVKAIDTTAAGDTFIGYFLAAYSKGIAAETALQRACAASAIAVTRPGAAQSIPSPKEVDDFLAIHTN